MQARTAEAARAAELTRQLRAERAEHMSEGGNPLSWHETLADELRALLLEVGFEGETVDRELDAARKGDDPTARLEGLVVVGRLFREAGELDTLAAEIAAEGG